MLAAIGRGRPRLFKDSMAASERWPISDDLAGVRVPFAPEAPPPRGFTQREMALG